MEWDVSFSLRTTCDFVQAGAKYIVSAFPKLPTDVSNHFESLVVKMVIPSEIEHEAKSIQLESDK